MEKEKSLKAIKPSTGYRFTLIHIMVIKLKENLPIVMGMRLKQTPILAQLSTMIKILELLYKVNTLAMMVNGTMQMQKVISLKAHKPSMGYTFTLTIMVYKLKILF